ncbi:hypothetical protein [cf. Phormidesmis sp. LEGE 11477]|uniref:hypothetical protein n=1 Tax=cf. Phormidesmis sp. LEGE 11477 TaxID=1828680 RepID=UPI00187E19D0|nr:hypothetical protein [cf. Phormidesmis sp. LEGE 11477]MBE9064994.1 hypothetical protein [cf. Phormidesmis sp. LEGE 11477]
MLRLFGWAAILSLATTRITCDSFNEFSKDVGKSIGQQPAEATDVAIGFDVDSDFPHRDRTIDGYYTDRQDGLTSAQLTRLFEHIAFPQSRGALIDTFGPPFDAEGDYAYWRIEGGSSYLAIRIVDGTAYSYTVGY